MTMAKSATLLASAGLPFGSVKLPACTGPHTAGLAAAGHLALAAAESGTHCMTTEGTMKPIAAFGEPATLAVVAMPSVGSP